MSQDRKALQVEMLQEEQKQTLQELARLREALKSEVDPEADEGDPDLAERDRVMALVQTLERKLDSVEHALRQAQAGIYGICERCGKPIDPARLEAVPEATLCVKCKSVVEQKARMGMASAHYW